MTSNPWIKSGLTWLIVVIAAGALFINFYQQPPQPNSVSPSKIAQDVQLGNVRKISANNTTLTVTYKDGTQVITQKATRDVLVEETLKNLGVAPEKISAVDIVYEQPSRWGDLVTILVVVVPLAFIAIVFVISKRQAQSGNNQVTTPKSTTQEEVNRMLKGLPSPFVTNRESDAKESVATKSHSQQGETTMATKWEYEDYLIDYNSLDTEAILGPRFTLAVLRDELWGGLRSKVMEDLRSWFDEGWEPITPIGADCIAFEVKTNFWNQAKVYLKEIRIPMRRPTKETHDQSDVPTLLTKLAELRDAGVITPEEFAAKKSELLGKM